MRTVRKLAAVLACTAMLSVVGAATAGAQGPARCDRIARITERIEAKQARVAARLAEHPRAANAATQHQPRVNQGSLQAKVAKLQALCSG